MTEPQPTPLFSKHQALGAKIVDFGGWALPVNYGSQIEEHNAVRTACGMFDVSHMTVSDVSGVQTLDFLRHLLANDIDKVCDTPGKALYSCMLNQQGGVIDDLIVYHLSDEYCRFVTNAGTREPVMSWMLQQSQAFDVQITERPELALLAVQGPEAISVCKDKLNLPQDTISLISALQRFQGGFFEHSGQQEFVGRTGYTGEDGLEFIVGAELVQELWQCLVDAGVQPCGLGARDTLRLESGMALYGNDLDTQHSPLESGLGWTVSFSEKRDFIGKAALQGEARYRLIGLILQDRGVLRSHQKVFLDDREIGEVTSGTFSPTLQQSIALARIDSDVKPEIGEQLHIRVRDRQLAAVAAKYPFVRNGKATN
ncbi:MAG: glycine cleavage system aminomethyltransferase GcvT [Arenicella sp.]|nr:glycine cleavage system aminomethyltransferase GcvT [Arenicella sp.]